MAVELATFVREVPDFPEPGVVFRDITPLLGDAGALRSAHDDLARPWGDAGIDVVVGIEARGFLLGTPVAERLGAGFAPIRKAGKLPWRTISHTYELEYGTDTIEIHNDAVSAGQRVVVLDDVLATGGTAAAAVELIERLEGEVVGLGFLIELAALGGRRRLGERRVEAVIAY
jgi:adenine phosphoribosyltransferase